MELIKFKAMLQKLTKETWYKFSYREKTREGWARDIYKKYARLTELIDYKCDFDESGICVERRRHKGTNEMCCCSGCATTVGWNPVLPKAKKDLKILAKFYSRKTGYWRSGKGCMLPRDLRSSTCLTHKCGHKLNECEENLLLALHSKAGGNGVPRYYEWGNNSRIPKAEVLEKELLKLKQNEGIRKTWRLLKAS